MRIETRIQPLIIRNLSLILSDLEMDIDENTVQMCSTSILIPMGVRLSGKAAGSLLNFDTIENRDLSYHKKFMINKVLIIYLQKA